PPWLATLTALAGFLVPPALLVAYVAASTLAGRTLHVIDWLWPLTALMVGVQAVAALLRPQTPAWIGVPLAAYGTLVATLAVTRWLVGMGVDPGHLPTALLAAQHAVLSPLLGSASLETGRAILVPVLAPLFPARWIAGRVARPAIAIGAAVWTALLCFVALPRAARALDGFAEFARVVPADRTEPELLLGLRVFGPLTGPPAALAVRNDLALLDSLGARVALVTLRPAGTSLQSLDSLARVLAPFRTDSAPMLVAVTLGYDASDADLLREDPAGLHASRMSMTDRTVRALRPDMIFPGDAPPGPAPDDWLRTYLADAAGAVHLLRPRTLVGLTLSSFDARDSALYSWATSGEVALDLVAFEIFPTLDGAPGLEARITTAHRWLTRGSSRMPHWVIAGGYPYVFGERSQLLAIRRAQAWASRVPAIGAFIVADAADYDRLTGLRAAGGRLRAAGNF